MQASAQKLEIGSARASWVLTFLIRRQADGQGFTRALYEQAQQGVPLQDPWFLWVSPPTGLGLAQPGAIAGDTVAVVDSIGIAPLLSYLLNDYQDARFGQLTIVALLESRHLTQQVVHLLHERERERRHDMERERLEREKTRLELERDRWLNETQTQTTLDDQEQKRRREDDNRLRQRGYLLQQQRAKLQQLGLIAQANPGQQHNLIPSQNLRKGMGLQLQELTAELGRLLGEEDRLTAERGRLQTNIPLENVALANRQLASCEASLAKLTNISASSLTVTDSDTPALECKFRPT